MLELIKIIEIPSLKFFSEMASALTGCAASPVVETMAVEPNTAKYFKKSSCSIRDDFNRIIWRNR
jgi:hypothetical protein